ncbi:MAG: leucyl aminopeptidase [Gemmatimonadota bacterium]|nr:leucyl aminopeptidase [Gemmatimonadota bacterium]
MSELSAKVGLPDGHEVDVLAVPWMASAAPTGAWWEAVATAWLGVQTAAGTPEPSGWVGLGDPDRPDLFIERIGDGTAPEVAVRRAAGSAVRAARERGAASIGFVIPPGLPDPSSAFQAAAEGLGLGDWRYDNLRDVPGLTEPPGLRVIYTGSPDVEVDHAAVDRGWILAAAQNVARELIALPGNVATPRYLADAATRLGSEHGFEVQVWGESKLREEGFGALLAVARGSVEEPQFLILDHKGAGGDPHVIVGKGVTFDAGGISIKPAAGMEDMKYDMSGAAAVIGIMVAAAALDIPQRVIGLVPATENLPSGAAVKPGDVIRGLSGKSIEVINTDAEGRLILSDALTFAQRLSPQAIVDMATLTGACVIALGHHALALMTPDDELSEELTAAGQAADERVWRLPIWPEYRKQIDSEIADIKNTGGRPAGTITAGWFLRDFVDDAVPWAHLDIAGTAWSDEARGWKSKGAVGIGVRLVHEWLRSRP